MSEIGENLKKIRKMKGMTQQQVADALGVNRVSVTQWEIGDAKPPFNRIVELANLYKITTDRLIAGDPPDEGRLSNFSDFLKDTRTANILPLYSAEMKKNVPILGVVAGSHKEGAFQFEAANVIDYVYCPPALLSARDIYALYVVGDSMEPKFLSGDLIFVHPARPPRVGDTIVVQLARDPTDLIEGVIGVMHKKTEDGIEIKKYNPPAIIKYPSEEIYAIHRVLTNNDLYGV